MRIGIIGSRGIPNKYGGFEQFAEYLSVGLVGYGCEIWVYCQHNHPYQESTYKGVHLIHCFDPENILGTFGQFIYDFNCILDSRKRSFDLIYQLGYTSSAIWQGLLPKNVVIVTNMDGLEWQRNKYSRLVQKFLLYSEKRIIKSSHFLIADSKVIQDYLLKTYQVKAGYIAYGAEKCCLTDKVHLEKFNCHPHSYYLVIARMQADNNIEVIIQAVLKSETEHPLLIIGSTNNRFGRYLVKKYASEKIRFAGAVFDRSILNQLRRHALIYFHGHSGGGTNPSLLEAMASSAYICAHKNPFNETILGDDALYFVDSESLTKVLNSPIKTLDRETKTNRNLTKTRLYYNWELIVSQYFQTFSEYLKSDLKSER
ncbi:MAG: DUF1972 domain-containing protein [Bacteroidales bacterium]|nr:DUF1972 domain-containing protein [Bacteroidales bacterium]